MKSILAVLALVASTQANAMFISPDQIYTTIKCERKVSVPDLGLSVEVRQGGIAGLTQVVVSKFFLGHSSINKYYVRILPIAPGKLGAPMVYEGNDVRLSVNFTTAPDEKGGHIGYLETADASGNVVTEELSCQGLAHMM